MIFFKRQIRQNALTCTLLIAIISVTIYYASPTTNISISCIFIDTDDALSPLENTLFAPVNNNSIFFHETSCKADLNSRQACGVETAARAHPGRHIYVLFCSPVKEFILKHNTLAALTLLGNVKFGRVHISEYARGTPFEILVKEQLIQSTYPVEHLSDIIRFLTLSKYGGIYLDLDVIVAKSLDGLPENWLAKESSDLIASGIMGFSKIGIGRRFSEDIIREISNTFRPYDWAYNGPEAVTRVFKRMCTGNISNWSASNCQGFNIFEYNKFYPVHYSQVDYYFESGDLENNDVYTHHMWNQISKNKVIRNDSRYAKLAQMYCPTIYNMYGVNFGTDA